MKTQQIIVNRIGTPILMREKSFLDKNIYFLKQNGNDVEKINGRQLFGCECFQINLICEQQCFVQEKLKYKLYDVYTYLQDRLNQKVAQEDRKNIRIVLKDETFKNADNNIERQLIIGLLNVPYEEKLKVLSVLEQK